MTYPKPICWAWLENGEWKFTHDIEVAARLECAGIDVCPLVRLADALILIDEAKKA